MSRQNPSLSVTSEHSLTGEKLSLLAVFAHPDDESFGPAGTLAKYASEGIQVSLVTATRASAPTAHELAILQPQDIVIGPRDRLCACRTSGVRRGCFFDYRPGQLTRLDPVQIEDQLVRLIREVQPQVIVTFGPHGLAGDNDHQVINKIATAAFHDAGDPSKFETHFREGLGTYTPQKLYYCVLPSSLVARWGVHGLYTIPDDQVTTVLDVSSYSEAMRNALYCQRSHALDYIRWLMEEQHAQWDKEYYVLVESRLTRKARREKDLFAGLR
ncbi:MAG: PIG-L family deacetylase [Chloroflexi bacterium]|nr:PIG-L family deacetylase [Chloroflexota bacterium]